MEAPKPAIDRVSSRYRGFTLIESLVASVVLAACVVGVGGLLVSVSQNTAGSEASLLAASRSQANLEAVAAQRLTDYSAVSGSSNSEMIAAANLAVGSDDYARTTATVDYVARTALQPSRDIAVISVTTTTPSGGRVTLYRAVTRAEMIR
jgi:prepilin-type N-terminal cleavage/methylation domain-containing protein